MTRLPSLSARQVLNALLRAGFRLDHQKGSHALLLHHATNKRTIVPLHGGDLPRWLLKQIIKQAGLTEREFRALI